jgi:hypothetical protein
VWSLLHEDLRPVASTVLPASTRISRPDGRKDQKVSIKYRSQIPNPDLGDAGATADAEDEGWEDEDTAANDEGDGDGDSAAAAPAPAKIPAQFMLDGAGLDPRGDLCRR